eukprot:914034-Rhodomonas_salina.1
MTGRRYRRSVPFRTQEYWPTTTVCLAAWSRLRSPPRSGGQSRRVRTGAFSRSPCEGLCR